MTQRLENFSTIIVGAVVLMVIATAMAVGIAIAEYRKNVSYTDFIETVKTECEHAPQPVTAPDGEVLILKYTKL